MENKTSINQWKRVALSEVTTSITRGISPSYSEDGVLVVNQKCIREGKVLLDRARITDPSKKKISTEKYLKTNDILICSTGVGTLGRVGLAGLVQEDITVDSHVSIVRPADNIDAIFLGYLLRGSEQEIESMAEGSTGQTELSRERLRKLEITIPPLFVQQNIGAILSSLDKKIELLSKQNKILEEITHRLFKEWFVDFNFLDAEGRAYKASGGQMVESEQGAIPAKWEIQRYSDLVSVLSGGTPKTDMPAYWNGQIPFFTPKDARDTFYVNTTEKYITEAGLSSCNSKLYPKDTVFITARGTVGKCALALRDMAMNQSCYALVGKDISNLFVFLLTKQLIEVIKKSASGAVFDAITVSTFHSLNVALGDSEVTDRFETLIRPMFNKIANNTEEILNLSELRDQLLPKLMSGEIALDRE